MFEILFYCGFVVCGPIIVFIKVHSFVAVCLVTGCLKLLWGLISFGLYLLKLELLEEY